MKHRQGFHGVARVFRWIVLCLVVSPVGVAQAGQDPAAPLWKVWEKISPCLDTRQDWFAVAQEYPGSIGSPQTWQITFNISMPFAAAMASADGFKMGPGFQRRCCSDWAVFKNTRTQRFEVGRISPDLGAHPPELMQQSPGMCAENAFDMAGIPVGTIRDPRNLQLSTGATVTRVPDGKFVPFASASPSPDKTKPAETGTAPKPPPALDCTGRLPQIVLEKFKYTSCESGDYYVERTELTSNIDPYYQSQVQSTGVGTPEPEPTHVKVLRFAIYGKGDLDVRYKPVAGIGEAAAQDGIDGGATSYVNFEFVRGRFLVHVWLDARWRKGIPFMMDVIRALDAQLTQLKR